MARRSSWHSSGRLPLVGLVDIDRDDSLESLIELGNYIACWNVSGEIGIVVYSRDVLDPRVFLEMAQVQSRFNLWKFALRYAPLLLHCNSQVWKFSKQVLCSSFQATSRLQQSCPVCLTSMPQMILGGFDSCCHTLCVSCALDVSLYKNQCPLCRQKFRHVVVRTTKTQICLPIRCVITKEEIVDYLSGKVPQFRGWDLYLEYDDRIVVL